MRTSVLLAATLLAMPARSAAQVQIGLGAGRAFPTGDYWDRIQVSPLGIDADASHGLAVDVQLLFGVFDDGQVGLAVGYSRIGTEESGRRIGVFDIAAVGRYFVLTHPARFFIGGMIGYSRHATPWELVSHGSVMGPTLGVQIPARTLHIELAVDGLRDVRGDWTQAGRFYAAPYGKGFRIVPRVSVVLTPRRAQ